MNPSVASWRRQQRAALLMKREAMSAEERSRAATAVAEKLDRLVAERGSTIIGIYWPIRNELNLIPWARALTRRSETILCLPVVVAPNAPLEYWRWQPGGPMRAGIWNIPNPAERDVLLPDLVLAPLVGFDLENYRLGYGGGYFDRTLAGSPRRPFAIGIGYDFCGLETIFPQPYDVPMNAILTEGRERRPASE
jgi:5,10-methenyltetrahydrofolate synthetase